MPPIAELTPLMWVLLAFAAFIVGVSKTGLPGVITVSIVIFAAILPAKASTGALLLTLLIGDVFALLAYRRHADWPTLIRLLPTVALGVANGAVFLAFAGDGTVRTVIGAVLLVVIGFGLWQRWRSGSGEEVSPKAAGFSRAGYGVLGGFTTMVANAGGPVITMYLLSARFQVLAFLGTASWFFAVLNVTKLPIAIGLGLITADTLWLVLLIAPAVVVGAFVGRLIAKRIAQEVFDWIAIIGTILGALYLLIF